MNKITPFAYYAFVDNTIDFMISLWYIQNTNSEFSIVMY